MDAVRRDDVDILVAAGDHPGRCSRRWTLPGSPSCCRTGSGEPDCTVAGTMIFANRAARPSHVRLRTHVPGLAGDVRRARPCSACTRSRRSTRTGLARRPRARSSTQAEADDADLIAGRHERHPGPRRDAQARRRRVPRRERAGQRGLAADLAGQPRRDPPVAAAAGADRPRARRRLDWPRSARHTVDIDGTDHLALVATVAGGERAGPPPRTRRTPSSTAGTAPGAPLDPPGVAALMAGFDRPWWLVGGWSIEAFTGVAREHEDVDLSILACDVPAFRAHLGDAWTPWSNDGGHPAPAERPVPGAVRRREPDLAAPRRLARRGRSTSRSRRTATASGPASAGRSHVAPVDDVTWVADDGIRYLRPEITLHFKARLQRPKDERDLEVDVAAADRGPAGLAARRHHGHRGAGPPVAAGI